MSDTKKRIVVDAGSLSTAKTRKRSPHKLSSSKLKEQFIKKVRALQKKKLSLQAGKCPTDASLNSNNVSKSVKPTSGQLEGSFKESMSFLQTVSSKPEPSVSKAIKVLPSAPLSSSQPSHTVLRPKSESPPPLAPCNILKPSPPYSNLKGSDKPTYRQWKAQTAKRSVRSKVLQVKLDTIDSQRGPSVSPPRVIKPTSKRTVKVGKHGNRISLIVYGSSDTKTRPPLTLTSDTSSMRRYLRSRNLIENGSQAPNDVVRSLYKDSTSAGEVSNKNCQTSLHNLHKE